MNETIDEKAEPDDVADQLIVERNEITKTHTGDFHLHFEGFAFSSYVDRSLPIHRYDEVIAIRGKHRVAHGVVVDSRQYDYSTEFFAVPEIELL